MADTEEPDIAEVMKQYSEQFDKLCQERHLVGIQEYGQFTFLGNDVVRMMMEELADTSNYCRMQFIKLMMLNEYLSNELEDKVTPNKDGEITIGLQAFRGTKNGWDANGNQGL